ncbi:MAG: hypothetical protein EA365_10625 [Gloeocapsa sp. DLM2.Bin57]|nr:MAG: hypothetical protein EA365_10625 [Gloeocapsa sp. DLM2.Bin57]
MNNPAISKAIESEQINSVVVSTENITVSPPPISLDKNLEPHDVKLLRLFIDYVKHTGEFDYDIWITADSQGLDDSQPKVSQEIDSTANGSTPNDSVDTARDNVSPFPSQISQRVVIEPSKNEPYLTKEKSAEYFTNLNNFSQRLAEISPNIIITCLSFKALLNQWIETLCPTFSPTHARILMEQISEVEKEQFPFLIYDLKAKHQQLAKYLDRLVYLGYQYRDVLETISCQISRRSINKTLEDLSYIKLYIEKQAQITKIQQEIFLAPNPSVYMRRLNHYLDILPELMGSLVNRFENLSNQELN